MKTTSYKTRLDRIQEEKSYHKLFFSIFFGIIMLVFVAKWGVSSLISMSVFISNLSHRNDQQIQTQNNSPLFPPSIEPIPEATNSSPIVVKGFSDPNQTVEIYVNGDLADNITSDSRGEFTFPDVNIKEGTNSIWLKVKKDNVESNNSQTYSIIFKKSLPKLEINKPENDQTVSTEQKTTEVSGLTDPGNTVTINDRFVIVNPDGSFTYSAVLNDGDNSLKIIATDPAGNKTTTERKVIYSAPTS